MHASEHPSALNPSVPVDHEALRATMQAVFERVGFSAQEAWRSADCLVAADLRGVESHGVSNMPRRYLDWLESGHLNARPQVRLLRDMPATAAYDADAGLGIAVLPELMQSAIDKAKQCGVGMISVRNARHSGMLAYHAMLALRHDMIGLCATSGAPRVVPTFGREARLGTNPLSVAVPTADEPAFVFDAATSTVAYNKIANARRTGEPLGPGWCADAHGTPLTEPSPSDQPLDKLMLPLGASPESGSHKGYSLAAIVEILASLLPGGTFMGRLGSDVSGHFLAAIDPSAFGDLDDFKRQVSDFGAYLRSTPPALGHDRVLVPNDMEWETERTRRRDGVPLHREVIEWLDVTCDRLGVPRLRR